MARAHDPGRARRAAARERRAARRAERRRRPAAAVDRRDDGPPARRARHEGRPAARERVEDDEAIHERLAKVDESTAQVLEQAKAFGKLEQALRPPKARGGFGELLLANLLRDRLPAEAFELQYGFRGGERVDAVVKVERLIPVDAKFPLDNCERMVEAEDDDGRVLSERAFARDLKTHVDAIATKYIRPDEGTYDFALMYLPAEAVYYELVCGKTGALLAVRARQARLPRLADDALRPAAGDRARAQGPADRAARARGDGVRARSCRRTSAASRRTSTSSARTSAGRSRSSARPRSASTGSRGSSSARPSTSRSPSRRRRAAAPDRGRRGLAS